MSKRPTRPSAALAAVAVAIAALVVAACGGSDDGSGPPRITWYVFQEPSGAYNDAVANCNQEANGQYEIELVPLPTNADQQRELVVRRLAAEDTDIDIIGMDVYNVGRASDPLPARWRHLMDMPFGLRWHAAFAASRGKKMSYPEWGTGINSQGTGGGDDPHYVCAMAAWMKQLGERLSYQAYWNEKASFDAQLDSGRLPLAAQAYRAEFGPGASSESSAFCKGVLGGAP